MKVNEFERKFFESQRVLFVIQGCSYCRNWKSFIERYNTEVPPTKRIKVEDATSFTDFGIESVLVQRFKNFMKNEDGSITFPILFFQGERVTGAILRSLTETFIKVKLHKDFIIEKEIPYMFNQKCRYDNKKFGRKVLICEPMEEY